MAERFLSERNLAFLLYEVFQCGEYGEESPFNEHTRGTIDLYLGFSLRFAAGLLRDADREMLNGNVAISDGRSVVHPSAGFFRREFGAGGWITSTLPGECGGLDMPEQVMTACYHILSGASASMSLFPLLSQAVSEIIYLLAPDNISSSYIEVLSTGKYQGAVAFTESGAGSSLVDIKTSAEALPDGTYHITGHKVFVMCGGDPDSDGTVYLVLAKTATGMPSLFAVPSVNNGTSNDITVLSVDRMNGLRGVPFAQVTFGANNRCTANLLGEEGRGLLYAKLVQDKLGHSGGLFAGSLAERAFWKAWDYASARTQGRIPGDDRDRSVETTAHPAVKKLLLESRTISDSILALCLASAGYIDMARESKNEGERYMSHARLLYPLCGSVSVNRAKESFASAAAATGSYACLEESGFASIRNDMEGFAVHPLTPEVAGADYLLARIFPDSGKSLSVLLDEMRMTADECQDNPDMVRMASSLLASINRTEEVTAFLVELHEHGQEALALQDASMYMEMLWFTVCAWLWLRQATAAGAAIEERPNGRYARFYQGRLSSARYFFEYELPRIGSLAGAILSGQGVPFLFFPDQYRL